MKKRKKHQNLSTVDSSFDLNVSSQGVKGTSRGPEAMQTHLNDSYYTNV